MSQWLPDLALPVALSNHSRSPPYLHPWFLKIIIHVFLSGLSTLPSREQQSSLLNISFMLAIRLFLGNSSWWRWTLGSLKIYYSSNFILCYVPFAYSLNSFCFCVHFKEHCMSSRHSLGSLTVTWERCEIECDLLIVLQELQFWVCSINCSITACYSSSEYLFNWNILFGNAIKICYSRFNCHPHLDSTQVDKFT